MPTIKLIGAIKISINSGDHEPPHIHVDYAEHSTKVEIDTLDIMTTSGKFPSKKLKIVLDWLTENENQANARRIFYNLNPQLRGDG